MPRTRMSGYPAPCGASFALIAAAIFILALSGTGCTGDGRGPEANLDSTLVRAEQLFDQGKIIDARRRLTAGLAASSGTWKGPRAAGAYRWLGDLSLQAAQLDSALLFYSRAEEAFRGGAQRHEAFTMSLAIVDLHRLMQQEDDARDLATETLRLAALLGDSSAAQDARWALLGLYRTLEQPGERDRVAAALRASCRRSGDIPGEARVMREIALSEMSAGALDPAITHCLESITLAGKGKDSAGVVRALLLLAETFDRAGKTREAQEAFATAMQQCAGAGLDPALHLEALLRTGNFFLRTHHADFAIPYFQKVYALAGTTANSLASAYALLQHGQCEAAAKSANAGPLFRRAFDILQNIGDARGLAYALVSIGQLAEQENKITDATQLYRASIKAQESVYAATAPDDLWFDCATSAPGNGGADGYGAMISLLLQTGRNDEAFWYQERRNARALYNNFAAWNVETGAPGIDSMLHAFGHLRAVHTGAEFQLRALAAAEQPGTDALLNAARQALIAAQERLDALGDRIVHADARWAPLVHPDGVTVGDIQRSLGDDVTLLTYLPTRQALHISAITPTRSTMSMGAVGENRVNELARQYLDECATRARAADSAGENSRRTDGRMLELSRALYEAMLLPVEPSLRQGGQLLIVLPAQMPVFSLAGLRRGGSGAPPLLERCPIGYLPVARFAGGSGESGLPIRSVDALGIRGSTGWDVEYELRDIHAFYREAQLLFGKEATLAGLRALHPDLLHLAVEVRFNTQRPLRGALVLGDGITEDGAVPVPLSALFVFPAVRSVVLFNLSDHVPSVERAVAAAFLINGSSAVVLNASPLTRKAKKSFGEGFYTALQSGATVHAAAASAQEAMLHAKELSPPQFWAPIMVWGTVGGREQPQR